LFEDGERIIPAPIIHEYYFVGFFQILASIGDFPVEFRQVCGFVIDWNDDGEIATFFGYHPRQYITKGGSKKEIARRPFGK
jgi:hypothetical protein